MTCAYPPNVIRRWVTGLLGSWLCVWFAGPWLVNSILIRRYDPALDVITLREGDLIRWRSEGWGSTWVGPHGLPGWIPTGAEERIVIWGDSQVEGFCVNDPDKINQQVISVMQDHDDRPIDCIPIGRSGSDAADWNRMLARADQRWQPIVHVWIVTELSDLLALEEKHGRPDAVDRWQAESPAAVRLAKRFRGEAMFQAARNLLLDPNSGGLRSLRFSLGPAPRPDHASEIPIDPSDLGRQLESVGLRLAATHQSIGDRLVIVYAPAVPRIVGGLVSAHPDDEAWNALSEMLGAQAIPVVDLRQTFIEHWNAHNEFARGFHNGMPGFGHLNPVGNRLIAKAICNHVSRIDQRPGVIAP